MKHHVNGRLYNEDICRLSSKAHSDGLKPDNVIAGFRKTGIVPLAPAFMQSMMTLFKTAIAFRQAEVAAESQPDLPNQSDRPDSPDLPEPSSLSDVGLSNVSSN